MSPEVNKLDGKVGFRRALVTGASGCIGRVLVRRLLSKGCEVNALVRDCSRFQELLGDGSRDGIRIFQGDLADAVLAQATEGIEAVFHTAARVHSYPQDHRDEELFFEVNVTGTEKLLEACRRRELHGFVFFSTIGVYGRHAGPVLTEETPPCPDGPYATSKYEAERRVREFFRCATIQPTILRLCLVYGEDDRGNFFKLLRGVDTGRFLFIGSGENRKSLTYVENVVDLALVAAASQAAQGETFLVADPLGYSLRHIVETLARHLGVKSPKAHLPVSLARLGVRAMDFVAQYARIQPPITSLGVEALATEAVCDVSKIRRVLGFESKIGLDEGVARVVAWYRQHFGR